MRRVLIAVLVVGGVVGSGAVGRAEEPARQAGPDSQPMPVFILIGQSNMNGAGRVDELPDDLKKPADDVLFANYWGTKFAPLAPAAGKNFGPEVTFGHEMAKALGRPIAMMKLATGGTSLEVHWNPASDEKSGYYNRLTGYLRSIRKANPNIRYAGVIWMQGEADAKFHSRTAEQYRGKFQALIDGIRKETGRPNLPFVAGRVNPPGARYLEQVREAQQTPGRAHYAWINCDDLPKHKDDLHYNTAGQVELGRRFASAMVRLMGEPSGPTTQPDCEWDNVARVVAVGDVHGDFDQFVKILRLAGVVDEDNDWTGGKTHLVQTGDVFDRGPDSKKAVDLLMKLEPQAAKAGGAVHALIGNHEAMVLLGDLRYMTDAEKESFGGPDGLREAMGPDGKYGRWIRGRNTAVRINDTVFIHGGLTEAAVEKHKTLAEINRVIRAELAEGKLSDGLAMSGTGPLWTRHWPSELIGAMHAPPGMDPGEPLGDMLEKVGAKRMVVGHTVSRDGVVAGLGGRLVMIDVGMSASYGGQAACVVIENGGVWVVQEGAEKRALIKPPAATQPDEAASTERKPAA